MASTTRAHQSDRSTLKTALRALAMEQRLARLHRDAANRMRPFDPGMSRLLDTLALEREAQHRQLRSLLQTVLGDLYTVDGARRLRPQSLAKGNFFVLSRSDATALVRRAARLERRAGRFYQRCARIERHEQLQRLYLTSCRDDWQRAEVLSEAVASLDGLPVELAVPA